MSPTRFTSCCFALLFVSLAAGCSSGENAAGDDGTDDPSGCSDQDGDDYGIGAECLGPDCNDFVATVHADAECAALCDGTPLTPGCPCDAAEPATCYVGPPETIGRGLCHQGITACDGGTWGACVGQIVPEDERCNDEDDDCDGVVDNGVLSECGTCGECERECAGPECDGWGKLPNGVILTPEGWLTLDGTAVSLHVIWPSSSETGDIFRVDTQTLEIEAAFWTGPNHAGGAFGGGDSPSRTAVDDAGNVIIANRAFSALASITKIAADPATCPDLDRDGRVETSESWDDKLSFDAHDAWEDECILWHTQVGEAVDANARALAIHRETGLDGAAEERGWVGMYGETQFRQFDVETGELTGELAPTPGCTPYGGAIDRDGWLWATCLSPVVGRFDTDEPDDSFETLVLPGGGFGYRVIVDEDNNPWISGSDVYRWDRDSEEFDPVGLAVGGEDIPVGNVASDGQGSIWVGTYTTGQWVWRIDNDEDMEFKQIDTPGVFTFGTAVDFDGHAWAFDYMGGTAAVIDLDTEEVTVALNDCGGSGCLHTPYVRGDITGLQRRNALNPTGGWSRVFEGCEQGDTHWTRALVDAFAPPRTRVVVSARSAGTLPDLAAAPWMFVGNADGDAELDLDGALGGPDGDGAFMELRVVLESEDRATAPILRAVEVQWGCAPIIG